MSKNSLIPSKQQYQKWSMPSKVTYIAGWLAIVGIILSIILYFLPSPISKSEDRDIEMLRETQGNLSEDLKITQELLRETTIILRSRNESVEYWKSRYQEVYQELQTLKGVDESERENLLRNLENGGYEVVQNFMVSRLQQAINDDLYLSELLKYTGDTYFLDFDFINAQLYYTNAFEKYPENLDAAKSLIVVNYRLGNLNLVKSQTEYLLQKHSNQLYLINPNWVEYPCRSSIIDLRELYIDVLRQLGDFVNAEKFCRQLIRTKDLVNKSDTCEFALLLSTLGLIEFESGDIDRAEYNYLQSLRLDTNIVILNNLGDLYLKAKNFNKAYYFFTTSYMRRKNDLGDFHLQTGFAANRLGEYYRRVGEFQKAVEYFEEALSIYNDQILDSHFYYSVLYNNYGLALMNMGEYEKSDSILQLGLKNYIQVYGEESPRLKTIYYNISDLQYRIGSITLDQEKKDHYFALALTYVDKSLRLDRKDEMAQKLRSIILDQI